MDCVEAPSFAIPVNSTPMEFFHSSVGLHQDCPLSSYLFILYADALSRALRATVQGPALEQYWPAPGIQPFSLLLFANNYLLIGRASIQNVEHFASIV